MCLKTGVQQQFKKLTTYKLKIINNIINPAK